MAWSVEAHFRARPRVARARHVEAALRRRRRPGVLDGLVRGLVHVPPARARGRTARLGVRVVLHQLREAVVLVDVDAPAREPGLEDPLARLRALLVEAPGVEAVIGARGRAELRLEGLRGHTRPILRLVLAR